VPRHLQEAAIVRALLADEDFLHRVDARATEIAAAALPLATRADDASENGGWGVLRCNAAGDPDAVAPIR
jgi:hypothetical protein